MVHTYGKVFPFTLNILVLFILFIHSILQQTLPKPHCIPISLTAYQPTGIWRTWQLRIPNCIAPSLTKSKVTTQKKFHHSLRCFRKFRHFSTSPAEEVDISLAFPRNLNEPRVLYSILSHCALHCCLHSQRNFFLPTAFPMKTFISEC